MAGAQIRVLMHQNMLRAKSYIPEVDEIQLATAEDGTFTLDQVEGRTTLRVSKGGFETKLVSGAPQKGWPDSPTFEDIALGLGVTLEGVVRDAGGEPVADARIVRLPRDGLAFSQRPFDEDVPYALATSDHAGRFVLEGVPLGSWSLNCIHQRYLRAGASGDATSDNNRPIEIELQGAATVTGRVRGLDPEMGTVSVACRGAGESEDDVEAYGFDQNGRRHPVSADGTFTVAGLTPGSDVWLDLWTGDDSAFGSKRLSARVTATVGDRDVLLDVATGINVQFSVMAAGSGKALPRLYAEIEFGDSGSALTPPVTSEDDWGWPGGIVRATDLVRPHPDCRLRIGLGAQGYERFTKWIDDPPAIGTLDLGVIELKPSAPVAKSRHVCTVSVRRESGAPAKNVSVEFEAPDERGKTIETDDEGVARFESPASGPCKASIRSISLLAPPQRGVHNAHFPGDFDELVQTFEANPAAPASLEFIIPDGATLDVFVTQGGVPAPSAEVLLHGYRSAASPRSQSTLRPENGGWLTVRDDGRAHFESLALGEWTVSVRAPGETAQRSHVVQCAKGTERVEVPLDLPAINGQVVDRAGAPVAGALVALARTVGRPGNGVPWAIRGLHEATLGGEETPAEIASQSWLLACTDADGRYTIRAAIDGADLVLHATAPGMTKARSSPLTTDAAGPSIEIDTLVLDDAGSVRVVLATWPPSSALVIAPAEWSSVDALHAGRSVDEEQPVLRGLSPGPWQLLIYHEDETSQRIEFAVKEGEETRVTPELR